MGRDNSEAIAQIVMVTSCTRKEAEEALKVCGANPVSADKGIITSFHHPPVHFPTAYFQEKNHNSVEEAILDIMNHKSSGTANLPPPRQSALPPTDGGNTTGNDPDLARAIAASLEAANAQANQGDLPAGISQEDAQMQQALAMSIQTGQGGHQVIDLTGEPGGGEDTQLQQAMLASIQSAGAGAVSVVSSDPTTRKRDPKLPVGLKNVGNTCYLNSLLQTYFMMPQIRRQVLAWPADQCTEKKDDSANFMRELQRMFGYLLLSNEKWFDPSKFFKSMVDESGQPVKIGSQEDASEFNDLFVKLMAKALSLTPDKSAPPSAAIPTAAAPSSAQASDDMQVDEPTKTTATGEAGKPAEEGAAQKPAEDGAKKTPAKNALRQSQSFQEHPLIKEMFRSDALEAKTVVEEGGTQSATTLTEFEFGRNFILPVGKHSDSVYRGIDNFLKDVAEFKTDAGAKAEMSKIKWFKRLSRVLMFHINRVGFANGAQVKINDAFKYFDTIFMDRYLSNNMEVTTKLRVEEVELRSQLESAQAKLQAFNNFDNRSVSLDSMLEGTLKYLQQRSEGVMSDSPDPVAEQILSCLNREKQNRIDLEGSEKGLNEALDQVYASLQTLEYKLVGVWMHSGSASGGHFWAYIRDFKSGKFMKFNDIFVSEISEEEVLTNGVGGTSQVSAYFLLYMSIDEYKREIELAAKDDLTLAMPASLKKEIDEANDKFTKVLEEHLKNSDDKKVEKFVSMMDDKLKSAVHISQTYQPAKDLRVRSYSAWLESLGLHDHMEMALAHDLWTFCFFRGISKDMDTTAFKLACQKLPQGEPLLRKAIDMALNPEADQRLRKQHKAFQTVFQLFATGVHYLNSNNTLEALQYLGVALQRNNELEFEASKRPYILNVLKVTLLQAKEDVLDNLKDHSVVALFDVLIKTIRAFIPNEDDPLVNHIRDTYVSEIVLKANEIPAAIFQGISKIGERWLEGDKDPLKVNWKVTEPKPYDEPEQWEELVNKTKSVFLGYMMDSEVYIIQLKEIDASCVAQPFDGADKVSEPANASTATPASQSQQVPTVTVASATITSPFSTKQDPMELD